MEIKDDFGTKLAPSNRGAVIAARDVFLMFVLFSAGVGKLLARKGPSI
jgi:hypothetical protein